MQNDIIIPPPTIFIIPKPDCYVCVTCNKIVQNDRDEILKHINRVCANAVLEGDNQDD